MTEKTLTNPNFTVKHRRSVPKAYLFYSYTYFFNCRKYAVKYFHVPVKENLETIHSPHSLATLSISF